ncbi:MAG TPA: hypothetical protein VF171_01120 [Trueperaceae bacterium]
MQSQLIPDSVFLLPLLLAVTEVSHSPIHVELRQDFEEPVMVESVDGIRIPLEDVGRKLYQVDVNLEGETQVLELQTDRHVSAFQTALITECLRQNLVHAGHKVTMKAESKEGIDFYSIGIDVAPGPMSSEPEVFQMLQAWLDLAGRVRRRNEQRTLHRAAQDQIGEIREQRRREAEERSRREQEDGGMFRLVEATA